MNLTADHQFGQYRLVRLLGRGGMGEVYEAEHTTLDLRYALKLLPADFASRRDAVERFRREAKVMAKLQHEHIVRVDEFGETAGRYWLRMELVRGVAAARQGGAVCTTLGEYAAARGGRIEQGEFAEILKQILEALAYAHSQGVVHRDLKPGNILLEGDASGAVRVKVSDFGLARVVGEEFIRSAAQVSVSRSLGEAPTVGRELSLGEQATVGEGEGTSTRALLGTWEYMSPEQRRGEAADARSDVYAVGLMCYRLLTGRELSMKLLSQSVAGLSPAWDGFVSRALEQEPGERYADGGAMLEAFGPCQGQLKSEIRKPKSEGSPKFEIRNPKSETISKSGSRKPKAKVGVFAGVAALALLGLGIWYWGMHLPEAKRRAELARLEAEARAAKDAAEQARLEAEAERLRTEREKQAAAEKAKAEAEQRERERRANARGGVTVETEPSGAKVMLGGEDVQSSPASFKQIKLGKYPLKITLNGYEPVSREVEVKENEFTDVGTIRLVRSSGGLKLTSEPSGAEYELSGPENTRKSGRTPGELSQLPTGDYRYTVKRGDWEQSGRVTVERNATVAAQVEFAYGSVRVTSEPGGAEVSAEGKVLGVTPLTLTEQRPGRVSYSVSLGRYKPASVSGVVEGKRELALSVQLEKVPYPTLEGSYENSLGMRLVPVAGTEVLFCVWETRVRDFEVFVKATGHDATSGMYSLRSEGWQQRGDTWKSPGFSQGPTHPVCGVSWEDARAFCAWLTQHERQQGLIGPDQSYRLPADWEWSVAVGLNESRGGTPAEKDGKTPNVYPWGSGWPPPNGAGNYAGREAKDGDWPSNYGTIEGYRDGYARTSPVGSFQANRFGLYDLGGNVWEWCEDWYDDERKYRVLRGASWNDFNAVILLSSYRVSSAPGTRSGSNGFRVVLVGGSSR